MSDQAAAARKAMITDELTQRAINVWRRYREASNESFTSPNGLEVYSAETAKRPPPYSQTRLSSPCSVGATKIFGEWLDRVFHPM